MLGAGRDLGGADGWTRFTGFRLDLDLDLDPGLDPDLDFVPDLDLAT